MSRSRSLTAALIAVAVMASGYVVAAGQKQRAVDGRQAAMARHRETLDRYCVTCHNDRLKIPSGNPLLLDQLDLSQIASGSPTWEKVVRKLRSGAMPPLGRPRPEPSDSAALAGWLEGELDRAAAASPEPGRVLAVHRLSRTEYRNAVGDLLALEDLPKELDIELLLPADTNIGFDTVAETLFVTPTVMDAYLSAARKISRLVVGDANLPQMVDTYRLPLELPQDDQFDDLPIGTRGGILIRGYFPVDGDYVAKIELAGVAREPHELEVSLDGQRIKVFTVGGAERAQGSADGGEGAGSPQVRMAVAAGPRTLAVTFVKKTSAASEALVRPYRRGRGQQPAVAAVTINGPFAAVGAGDTPSRRRLFVCQPTTPSDEEPCVRRIASTLLRRAYRRPVTDADVESLLPIYRAARAEGSFEKGIETIVERVLVSPEFLLRIEYRPPGVAPGSVHAIADVELASRLSFFLWSSMPDDELLDVAVSGTLRQPEMLERQVRRMLTDPRSNALVENFAAQWLYLRDLQARRPNDRFFPDFDDGLRQALLRETGLFLGSIIREDRSVRELLTANYTFVNERLARHYGIPNIYGSHFRRITLPDDSERRGLLGQGSILTLTSYSTRTSPVVRGKWILENILGTPPPPPPPNVPALKDTTAQGKVLSMRERMAQHRANPVCASCHTQMDPLGFALENFDAVGQWRTHSESGAPIDASGMLPDGARFDGIVGLRQVLAGRTDRLAATVTEKLLAYAVGRELGSYDSPVVRAITRDAAANDYRFSSIVLGIVKSTPFQMRRSD